MSFWSIIVGAPRNSVSDRRYVEPGSIFDCPMTSRLDDCSTINIDYASGQPILNIFKVQFVKEAIISFLVSNSLASYPTALRPFPDHCSFITTTSNPLFLLTTPAISAIARFGVPKFRLGHSRTPLLHPRSSLLYKCGYFIIFSPHESWRYFS